MSDCKCISCNILNADWNTRAAVQGGELVKRIKAEMQPRDPCERSTIRTISTELMNEILDAISPPADKGPAYIEHPDNDQWSPNRPRLCMGDEQLAICEDQEAAEMLRDALNRKPPADGVVISRACAEKCLTELCLGHECQMVREELEKALEDS